MVNEKRLIDANACPCIKCDSLGNCRPGLCSEFAEWWLCSMDAVEVVRGRWLYDSGSGKYFCSACDENALSFKKDTIYGGDLYEVCLTDYCPNCGAKMDLE